MKLQAEVGSENSDIEIHRDGRRLIAKVGDREYDLEVSEPEPDTYLLKHGGRIFEAMVLDSSESSGTLTISVAGKQTDVRLWDPKRLRGSSSDSSALDGPAEIRSAMPGKIVRVLVETGDYVKKGQGVIVVEAMKMQNELKSPKDGQVREIRVGLEDTVSSGDVLVTID